jgi:hypothetical protein
MTANSKNTRVQSRLEKAARENANLTVGYEAQAKIIREKTARLKALRLAAEAQGQTEKPVEHPAKPTKRRPARLDK